MLLQKIACSKDYLVAIFYGSGGSNNSNNSNSSNSSSNNSNSSNSSNSSNNSNMAALSSTQNPFESLVLGHFPHYCRVPAKLGNHNGKNGHLQQQLTANNG